MCAPVPGQGSLPASMLGAGHSSLESLSSSPQRGGVADASSKRLFRTSEHADLPRFSLLCELGAPGLLPVAVCAAS